MRRIKHFPEVMEIEAYIYTAGPVGTKWLEALKAGRLTAAYCPKCGRLFMPPKMFCPYDFEEVKELREVEPVGIVETYTRWWRGTSTASRSAREKCWPLSSSPASRVG
jgi:uncharacterized OB-fold protein